MKLYHGTAERHVKSILRYGLRPRSKSGQTNWKHTIESNPDTVYLTDSYPLHFAGQAAEKGDKLVVVEVDTDRLLPWLIVPDEDFLEQASRKSEQFPAIAGKDIQTRTRWFRKRVMRFQPNWELSLKGLGTVGYKGLIRRAAITRYALVKPGSPTAWASDPTITLLNQQIMGDFYRAHVAHIFGDPVNYGDASDQFNQIGHLANLPKDDCAVFNVEIEESVA